MAFDKLKFWKKEEEDYSIDDDIKKPIPGVDDKFIPKPSFDSPMHDAPRDTGFPSAHRSKDFSIREKSMPNFANKGNKNEELILAKLDAIKAMVENMNRRLERIEEIALEEQRERY